MLEHAIQQRIDALDFTSTLDEMAEIAATAKMSGGAFDRSNYFRVLDVVAKSASGIDIANAAVAAKIMQDVKPRHTGHGSANLLAGDVHAGYYGQVDADTLFYGDDLAALLGVDQGELMNSDAGWFKFSYRGRIVFVPMRQFMHSVSWDHLYERGIVYGTDDNGLYSRGTPVNQYATVEKDGQEYVCQLLTGAASDPIDTSLRADEASPLLGLGMGSMWNELIYRVSASVPAVSDMIPNHGGPQVGDNWADFSDADLGITGNGRWRWTQETASESTSSRVSRGNDRVSYFARGTASGASAGNGWLPCLVLKS